MEKEFFMVFRMDGSPYARVPGHQHQTMTEAMKEAERLAIKNNGVEFCVFRAVMGFRIGGVTRTMYGK